MPRRKSAGGLTIGFYGTGAMDADAALKYINDFIESANVGEDPLRFIFPVNSDEWSDNLTDLVNLASNGDIPYEVITSPDERTRRIFTDIIAGAANRHHVEDPIAQMVTILGEAPGARLFVLWDDERTDDMTEVLARFLGAGVLAFDLTDGLTEIGFRSSEEPEEAEEEAQPKETVRVEVETYTRPWLEKQTLATLREIGAKLGVKSRKSSAAMIADILDTQQAPAAEEPEAPERPLEAPVRPATPQPEVAVPVSPAAVPEDFWNHMEKLVDSFAQTLLSGLAQILSD